MDGDCPAVDGGCSFHSILHAQPGRQLSQTGLRALFTNSCPGRAAAARRRPADLLSTPGTSRPRASTLTHKRPSEQQAEAGRGAERGGGVSPLRDRSKVLPAR